MKNLIKEIEELRDFSLEDSALDIVIREITNETVDKVLSILNQHNIITAPKQIKLSEIVERLKQLTKLELSVECGFRSEKAIGYYIIGWEEYDFDELVGFDKDMKITHISLIFKEETKWLYELWIAGTEIIDDMEEE